MDPVGIIISVILIVLVVVGIWFSNRADKDKAGKLK